MNRDYLERKVGRKVEDNNLSLSLIERGVPAPIAFSLRMLLGRGKTEKVNHKKTLMNQIKGKLKRNIFEGVDVKEIDGAGDVLEYLGLPGDYLEGVESVMNAGKGYSHVARVGSRNYLVRTNISGHKVIKTKDISDIFR